MKSVAVAISALLVASIFPGPARAAEPAAPAGAEVQGEKEASPQYDWLRRFRPYGLNYGVWKFNRGDNQALEAKYSFKYTVYDCERYDAKGLFGCSEDSSSRLTGFLSYTGKFDFYMFTRDSSPVINRTSNPALHANYEFGTVKTDGRVISSKWVDLSFEHRSDGQVVAADAKDTTPGSPTFGQYLTEIEYQKGNMEYFDRISRDANYFNLAYGKKFRGDTFMEVAAKLYVTDDADVTWGKYAGTGSKFKDFDLVKLKAFHTCKALPDYFPVLNFGLEYLLGRKGLATDSVDLYLIAPFISHKSGWEIPLMFKAHFGPMDRLSDYTRSVNSFAIGLAFSYF